MAYLYATDVAVIALETKMDSQRTREIESRLSSLQNLTSSHIKLLNTYNQAYEHYLALNLTLSTYCKDKLANSTTENLREVLTECCQFLGGLKIRNGAVTLPTCSQLNKKSIRKRNLANAGKVILKVLAPTATVLSTGALVYSSIDANERHKESIRKLDEQAESFNKTMTNLQKSVDVLNLSTTQLSDAINDILVKDH